VRQQPPVIAQELNHQEQATVRLQRRRAATARSNQTWPAPNLPATISAHRQNQTPSPGSQARRRAQIIRIGVTRGGHPGNLADEQIGGYVRASTMDRGLVK